MHGRRFVGRERRAQARLDLAWNRRLGKDDERPFPLLDRRIGCMFSRVMIHLRLRIPDRKSQIQNSDLAHRRIKLCEPVRTDADPIQEAQAPHQEDRAQGTLLLPPPEGRGDLFADRCNLTGPFEPSGEVDVFHDRDVGKASQPFEDRATDKNRLVAGRDAA